MKKNQEITKKIISKSKKLMRGNMQQMVIYRIPNGKNVTYRTKHESAGVGAKIAPSITFPQKKEKTGIEVRVYNSVYGYNAPSIFVENQNNDSAIRQARSLSSLSRFAGWKFTTNKA